MRSQSPPNDWRWYLSITFGAMLTLGGVWCLLHPHIHWTSGALLLMLGAGLIGLQFHLMFQPKPLSLEDLSESGIGIIVASHAVPRGEMTCQQCSKRFNTQPIYQGAAIYCSDTCRTSAHTRLEKPRYFLHPPLKAEEMNNLLGQAIQFAERAMRAANSHDVDRPLVIATHRGKGAQPKVQQVILSLKLYGQDQWAQQLLAAPPPEPDIQGGHRGTSQFFHVANHLQRELMVMDLRDNPFEVFQLTEPIELKDLQRLQTYDQRTQQAWARLEMLLQEGEANLQKLLGPGMLTQEPPTR